MHYSKSSHIGSCFSIIEILYTLYFEILNTRPANLNDPNRDIFILSKAHASAALYATLAFKGFFPRGWLKRYYIDDVCWAQWTGPLQKLNKVEYPKRRRVHHEEEVRRAV